MYWSPTNNGATFTGSGQWSLSITGDSVYLRVADGEALTTHLLNLVDLEVRPGIIDTEMKLHVSFCAGWGLSEADMERQPEAAATVAYTRYVLDCGMQGDLLDLQVALAPCIVGYGEIGARLLGSAPLAGNPYRAWIEMYGGAEYQAVAQAAIAALDDSAARRGGEARFGRLSAIFARASLLEADFWQMALAD